MSGELPPIGFWSYSQDDDRRARGRLSQLRALLAEELEARFGRLAGVRLFQDVSAIAYGDLWEQKITDALNQCSFLIPILTPDFLESEWCCKEVLHFQDREATLGRSGLIFPIHWVDTKNVNPTNPVHVHDRRVWDRLRATQRVELHPLRLHEPEKSIEVQEVLVALGARIEAALRGAGRAEPEAVLDPLSSTTAAATVPSGYKYVATTATTAQVPSPPARAKPGDIMREAPDLPEMVLIPPGTYLRGVPTAESQREGTNDDNARPIKSVTIQQPFWMGRYPVTWGEFAAFIDSTGHKMPNVAWTYEPNAKGEWSNGKRDNRNWRNPGFKQTERDPVVCVNHEDALAYIAWLNQRTNGGYRLPSEAEWEYAARAGTKTARYWGDGVEQAHLYANMADQSLRKHIGPAAAVRSFIDGDDGYVFTSPVGSFRSNQFGLHDMLGNVWEWCADTWHASYEGAPTDGSAWVDGGSPGRELRGGSWRGGAGRVRAALCVGGDPVDRGSDVGFRCARVQRESDQGANGA